MKAQPHVYKIFGGQTNAFFKSAVYGLFSSAVFSGILPREEKKREEYRTAFIFPVFLRLGRNCLYLSDDFFYRRQLFYGGYDRRKPLEK
jgi:hypothetical protein